MGVVNGPRFNQKRIVRDLLKWFGENARDLPWRRTGDPYAIWVSEIMLQQTQVKTVVPYWERWMEALPTIEALAKARPGRIHKLWEGLGYYTRVRNMQKAARVVCKRHGGKFPERFEEVLALPGIGPYTAGAICSIAYNQPKPILDGNVIRVLSRVFGIGGNPREKETNKRLWGIAEELVGEAEARSLSRLPGRNRKGTKDENEEENEKEAEAEEDGRKPAERTCSHLNQSLMELGALICRSKEPRCGICPVAGCCVALRENRVQELPNLSKRARVTQRRFVAFVAERGGRVLVRQRPAGVVNAHLWEFPNLEIARKEGDLEAAARKTLGFSAMTLERLCTIKHSITRYRMTLEVFRAGAADAVREKPLKRLKAPQSALITQLKLGVNERGPDRWLKRGELGRLAFCSAHKKIREQL